MKRLKKYSGRISKDGTLRSIKEVIMTRGIRHYDYNLLGTMDIEFRDIDIPYISKNQ